MPEEQCFYSFVPPFECSLCGCKSSYSILDLYFSSSNEERERDVALGRFLSAKDLLVAYFAWWMFWIFSVVIIKMNE